VRVLFDESMPRPLRRKLSNHQVSTVQEMGWGGTKNGVLLRLAANSGFDVLLTTDQSIPYQQDISSLAIAVVVLAVGGDSIDVLTPVVPQILTVLASMPEAGTVTVIGERRRR